METTLSLSLSNPTFSYPPPPTLASFSESASTVTVETEPKGAYPQTQPCLSPLASPEPVSSPPSAVAGATTSPLVDQLPCQLAYAPASLDNLLDWLLLDQLGSSSRSSSQSERTDCPLGPTFTIYLMFRAICRQCDRWDSLEANKATTDKVIQPVWSLTVYC
ncbi:unnamed protein product [Schistocephalus solidus]|uniref:Uncharacterized protein n=1 Tax=Schistocephalus solidus TaxID=70667 RepID=A0A3P7F5A2_SCHSO|nr:unnamed protein product [Schistocephalus solidus]